MPRRACRRAARTRSAAPDARSGVSMSRSSRSTWLDSIRKRSALPSRWGTARSAPRSNRSFWIRPSIASSSRASRKVQPHHADGGVGLVDGAIGGDAQIVFRAALAAAERSGAVVAGPGIDAVEHDHWRCLPLSLRRFDLPIAQTASMVMTMATNCSNTRSRISFCERFGEPPRIMLMRPSSSTSATARDRDREDESNSGKMPSALHNTAPGRPPHIRQRLGATIWLLVQ